MVSSFKVYFSFEKIALTSSFVSGKRSAIFMAIEILILLSINLFTSSLDSKDFNFEKVVAWFIAFLNS